MKINKYKVQFVPKNHGFKLFHGYKRFKFIQCWKQYPHLFSGYGDAKSFGKRYIGRTLRYSLKPDYVILLEFVIALLILGLFIYGITKC